jgi:hypothetical protein
MACVACMEIPTKGKCILDGCAVCCTCGRVIKPDAVVDKVLDKAKVYWRDGLAKVYSDTDPETIKKNVEELARENLKKILGKDAYLVKISIATDPEDPDAVNLTFSGPTELVEKIDEYNRQIK